ncbi:MAG: hypothetical protein MUE37_06340 [Bacteroidales bacterium]|jgi:hypothetical protein|nr:hypothetical protein [Bacteroidales bacterium]
MVHKLDTIDFTECDKSGIRVQVLFITTNELVMDIIREGDGTSTSVLNATSPAFTCAFPFAKHVVDNYVP